MLAKLLKEQEQSTEQINLLRKDVRDFAKEMQRDRLKFIESMKEMPSTPVQPSKTDSESSGESDNDKKAWVESVYICMCVFQKKTIKNLTMNNTTQGWRNFESWPGPL